MKKKTFITLTLLLFFSFITHGINKDSIPIITSINLKKIPAKTINKFWLKVGSDAYNNSILIPVLIAKGEENGTVLGLTAAIHGNELNGIPVIQEVFKNLKINKLKGIIIAIPGLNTVSVFNNRRRFSDHVDLNRIFPGKENGNTSQQMVFKIYNNVIKLFTHHIDMHTASFGRVNSMYARADLTNNTLKMMAKLQNPDIILASKGKPSFGNSNSQTLRAAAIKNGIHSITVEYGNPQVYQKEMTQRGVKGIENLMAWLKMIEKPITISKNINFCTKSYWLYTDKGGLLTTLNSLNDKVKKGDVIGILKNPFGTVIKKYLAPEDGIVIGKSTNPVSISGGRIIHLGILK